MKSNTMLLISQGLKKLEQGKSVEAIADFTQAIERNPEQGDAYLYRGQAQRNLGDFHTAIADLTQALRLVPNCLYAYLFRGTAYAELGLCPEAIADYTQGLRLSPQCPQLLFYRGLAYLKLGDTAKAKEELQFAAQVLLQAGEVQMYTEVQAILLSLEDLPRQFQIEIQNWVVKKARQGDLKGTLSSSEPLARRRPQDAEAYVNRGAARSYLGDYERGIADFSEAIKLNPAFVDAYLYRGISWGSLRQYQAAIDDFNQTLRLNPQQAAAYQNRGLAHYFLGERETAYADLGRACDLFQAQGNKDGHKKAWAVFLRLLSSDHRTP